MSGNRLIIQSQLPPVVLVEPRLRIRFRRIRSLCLVLYWRCFRANISKRALSTANVVEVLSYMMTTKASIHSMSWSAGVSRKRTNISVPSLKISHACHAVRLNVFHERLILCHNQQTHGKMVNLMPVSKVHLISHESVFI